MKLGSSRIGVMILAVVAFVDGAIVASLALDVPLGWLHAANGTLPALQTPIDLLITAAVAAGVAVVLWRWLGTRYAAAARRAAELPLTGDSLPSTMHAVTNNAAGTAKAELASTR